ncbi:MAG TPA: hypothetical protein VFP87_00795 [Chitinophagaceae bacterium]|nr:hypothetical protein [Chitinophagaceae bacterium]
MKKIVHGLLIICVGIDASAQFETGISYSMAIPLREMGKNINLTHSGVADLRYHFKHAQNFWVGAEFAIGVYAIKSQEQQYQFSNGDITDAKVNFTSNVFNAHVTAGADLLRDKAIIPYVSVKGGLSNFYTKVFIPDPGDNGSCKPLENKNVYKDNMFSAGFSAGAKIRGSKIFRKSQWDNWWIDLSATDLVGGTISYLNVKHLMPFNENTNYDSKGYNVTFVNLTTNEVHQHQVAQVYTSPINQLDLKLGVFFRL